MVYKHERGHVHEHERMQILSGVCRLQHVSKPGSILQVWMISGTKGPLSRSLFAVNNDNS